MQPIETVTSADGRTVPVAYSLGNFVSAQIPLDNLVGIVLRFTAEKTEWPDGRTETEIRDLAAVPVVMHYDANFANLRLYPFLVLHGGARRLARDRRRHACCHRIHFKRKHCAGIPRARLTTAAPFPAQNNTPRHGRMAPVPGVFCHRPVFHRAGGIRLKTGRYSRIQTRISPPPRLPQA